MSKPRDVVVVRVSEKGDREDDAYAYCKACHPGAIKPRWSRGAVLSAMREWRDRYGQLPTSYDWSRTHARRRGEEAARRLGERIWPAASVVTHWFGTWADARIAAGSQEANDCQGI
jgi:hypothetical protein